MNIQIGMIDRWVSLNIERHERNEWAHTKAWGGRLEASNRVLLASLVEEILQILSKSNKLLKLKKNKKNSSTAVCSLWPHCYLARLCLRTRSRTKTVLSMGSLNEPQKASEAKTGKNNFFLELNINDSFLMNINSWTSQATKGRAAINWNIRSALPLLPRP